WFTGTDVLIVPGSLGATDEENQTIAVHLTKEQIRHSPPIETERPVSRQYEEAYHTYYGWEPYWVLPGGTPAFWTPLPIDVTRPEIFTDTPDSTQGEREQLSREERGDDPHLRSSAEVSGYAIHAQDGHVGHLDDYVLDEEDWRIRYLIIDTRNWLRGKLVLISPDWISNVSFAQRGIFVSVNKEAIKGAPEYDPDQPISRALEGRLYEHHGYHAYWEGIHAARLRR
ncbi:MAG: PRC-barrel domain containing protein, partial [Verrucomicrobiaceae bacterium]